MVKVKTKPKANVARATVNIARRDPLAVPSRFKHPGFVTRWIRMGESPSDTEATIEEREELGYQVVEDPDKGGPVTKRNMILMEIPEKLDRERSRAKVEENLRMNRAQADINRANMSQLVGRSPHGKVLGEGLVTEPRETLLNRDEFAGEGKTAAQ